MTGNPSWSVLDLDDERLGDECVDIVEKVGVTWINSRLDFYEDCIEELFRPTGELLAEAPTRVAQMKAEAMLVWMAREDLEHMKVPSAQHEQVREAYEHDSNQDCWIPLGHCAAHSVFLCQKQVAPFKRQPAAAASVPRQRIWPRKLPVWFTDSTLR